MKLSTSCLAVLSATVVGSVTSFIPAPAFTSRGVTTDSTVLYISSWGTKGPPSRWTDATENKNPEDNIQSYLKAPEPVEARDNIDETVLVSGLVKSKERTDQFIFDLLNHEESAFAFKKIVAFVDDEKFAKKRLLSRSARYTGLLNKLDFVEASAEGALPTAAQLDGVKSWVAVLEDGDLIEKVKSVAALAKDASSLENISVLLTNAYSLDTAASESAVQALTDSGKEFTLVAVGKLEDHDEGKIPYRFKDFGTDDGVLPADAIFSRNEAMRMITETLQLNAGVGKALSFTEVYDVNATEAKLIKGLREAGYARPQEIDHMLRNGVEAYQKAIDEFREKNPDWGKGVYATEAWWEDPKFKASVEEAMGGKKTPDILELKVEEKDERTLEIEKIATEWAKREYFRQSMAGTVDEEMTEEAFIESVWDRALHEGDVKYRQMKGEDLDEEAELLDFKARQERKQQAMLKKAKEELKEILDEVDGGDGPNDDGSDDDE
ncbi:hypothetical protein IV203_037426 [Nitzschia inconspicua]|uniref:Uncharacterized protein n=1 Tax=Nitzschia inconspicua TaxID=303405 RepID=A0A9K3LLV7_9STRA|nr:hypothetical protein IV203_037426 [Nitzschia inconspicua]